MRPVAGVRFELTMMDLWRPRVRPLLYPARCRLSDCQMNVYGSSSWKESCLAVTEVSWTSRIKPRILRRLNFLTCSRLLWNVRESNSHSQRLQIYSLLGSPPAQPFHKIRLLCKIPVLHFTGRLTFSCSPVDMPSTSKPLVDWLVTLFWKKIQSRGLSSPCQHLMVCTFKTLALVASHPIDSVDSRLISLPAHNYSWAISWFWHYAIGVTPISQPMLIKSYFIYIYHRGTDFHLLSAM
jgi:hypothetical protein